MCWGEEDAARALLSIASFKPDVVLLDLFFGIFDPPPGTGVDILRQIRTAHPKLAVVILTATSTDPLHEPHALPEADFRFAKKTLRQGAAALQELQQVIRAAIDERNRTRPSKLARPDAWPPMARGASAAAQALRRDLELAAQQHIPVLLRGPNGAGLEPIARRMHELSARTRLLVWHADDRGPLDLSAAQSSEWTIMVGDVEALSRADQRAIVDRLSEDALRLTTTAAAWIFTTEAGAAALDVGLAPLLADHTINVPPLADRISDFEEIANAVIEEMLSAAAGPGDRVPLRSAQSPTGSFLLPSARVELEKRSWPGNVVELRSVLAAAIRDGRSNVMMPFSIPRGVTPTTTAATYGAANVDARVATVFGAMLEDTDPAQRAKLLRQGDNDVIRRLAYRILRHVYDTKQRSVGMKDLVYFIVPQADKTTFERIRRFIWAAGFVMSDLDFQPGAARRSRRSVPGKTRVKRKKQR